MPKAQDLTGKRFGRLVVLGLSDRRSSDGKRCWICQCDCGQSLVVVGGSLTAGLTKSCGCLQRDIVTKRNTKHGRRRTPEYIVWCRMISRCTKPSAKDYHNYGGRGITVCQRWLDFKNFIEDMGPRPSTTHSLDRINNDCGYTPQNCRWATEDEQINNQRRSRFIQFNGKRLTAAQWQKETGIDQGTITDRLDRLGWSIERALTTPTRKQRKR